MTSARMHYGFVVLALIVLAVFGSLGLGRFGYTSILPAMQAGLALTNTQTGALQSWNLAGYMFAAVFAGLFAARYGPRVVITAALFVTALGMMLTGFLPSFEGARVGRFLAGVGGAGGNVPGMGLVSAWFGARRRGIAAGAAVSGSSLGLIVTGPFVPLILARYGADGWRACWYILGVMALGVGVLCAWLLRNRPEERGLAILGEAESDRLPYSVEIKPSLFAWGSVWRSRVVWHLAVIYCAFGFSYVIYATFFIRYLVGEGGFSAQEAGLLWLEIGLVSIVSGFVWGGISDRWGRRVALMGVFALQGASFLVFGATHAVAGVYLSASLFAVTAWSIPALMAASAGDVFGARLAPAGIGLMTVVMSLGQVLGPYLAGRIADATHSFAPAFVTAGCVALALGAGGSFLLGPRMRTTDSRSRRGPLNDRGRLADEGDACLVDRKEGTP
jgi:MFS family permease